MPEGIAVARIVGVSRLIAQEIGLDIAGYIGFAELGVRSQTDARVL